MVLDRRIWLALTEADVGCAFLRLDNLADGWV